MISHRPRSAGAAIDRLVHHCIILELNIPSYRMEQAQKKRPDPPEVSDAATGPDAPAA